MKAETTNGIPICPYCKKATKRTENMVICANAVYRPPSYDENGTNLNKSVPMRTFRCQACKNTYTVKGVEAHMEYVGDYPEETFDEDLDAQRDAWVKYKDALRRKVAEANEKVEELKGCLGERKEAYNLLHGAADSYKTQLRHAEDSLAEVQAKYASQTSFLILTRQQRDDLEVSRQELLEKLNVCNAANERLMVAADCGITTDPLTSATVEKVFQKRIDELEGLIPACADGMFTFKESPWATVRERTTQASHMTWTPEGGWQCWFLVPRGASVREGLFAISECYLTKEGAKEAQ